MVMFEGGYRENVKKFYDMKKKYKFIVGILVLLLGVQRHFFCLFHTRGRSAHGGTRYPIDCWADTGYSVWILLLIIHFLILSTLY